MSQWVRLMSLQAKLEGAEDEAIVVRWLGSVAGTDSEDEGRKARKVRRMKNRKALSECDQRQRDRRDTLSNRVPACVCVCACVVSSLKNEE